MGCLLGKQDINDIHPDIFSVHNIDHEVCLTCLLVIFYFRIILDSSRSFVCFFGFPNQPAVPNTTVLPNQSLRFCTNYERIFQSLMIFLF